MADLARKAEKHVLFRTILYPFSGIPIQDAAMFPKPGFLHAISSVPQQAFLFKWKKKKKKYLKKIGSKSPGFLMSKAINLVIHSSQQDMRLTPKK